MTKWSVLVCSILAAGCAQVPDRVVLLPGAGGRTGALVVKTEKGDAELASPYAEVEVKGGTATARVSSQDEVRSRYGALLGAQPPRPRSFIVYFAFGTAELTAQSRLLLDRFRAEITGMPAAEIVITGHTDTMGPESLNDTLSLRRAEAVRDALLAVGIPRKAIEVAGRGERDLAVPTGLQVPEPKNRRAEIKVR